MVFYNILVNVYWFFKIILGEVLITKHWKMHIGIGMIFQVLSVGISGINPVSQPNIVVFYRYPVWADIPIPILIPGYPVSVSVSKAGTDAYRYRWNYPIFKVISINNW